MFRTYFDDLDKNDMRTYFEKWLSEKQVPVLNQEQLDIFYNSISPRSVFLKNLKLNSSILDMGAGNGALTIYKDWPLIRRHDLKMYALSLEVGEYFSGYESYEIGDFEGERELFTNTQFSAMVATHFIEHLKRPAKFIDWAAGRLSSGGRIYIEWPHQVSKNLPPHAFFMEHGFDVTTTNFFDDGTHVETWELRDIASMLEVAGFTVESAGRILLPFAAQCLRDNCFSKRNATYGTFAIWNICGWAQYLIAVRH